MTDYVSRGEALTVPCPACGAGPDESCEGTRANTRASVHRDRMDAALGARATSRRRPVCEVCQAPLDTASTCAMALYNECPYGRIPPTVTRSDETQKQIHADPDPAALARRQWWHDGAVGHYPGCRCAVCERKATT